MLLKHTPIYFDYNATAPLQSTALEAMIEWKEAPANASSVHGFGRRARQTIEKTRQLLLQAVNAKNMQVVFTSTGTEANNLALKGLKVEHIFVSAIEHPSVLKAAPQAIPIKVNGTGVIDLEAFEQLLAKTSGKALVSVMLANNETGVIQPLQKIVSIAKKYNALVHTDAVQALGKIKIDAQALGIDMMTVSAHKLGGPQGAAALLIRKGLVLESLLQGGGQEQGMRAGTENVIAISGFGAVLNQLDVKNFATVEKLRNELESELCTIDPAIKVIGDEAMRLPNTSCIVMPSISSETQLIEFDLQGFAVSAGSACSSGKVAPSHVLLAMGVKENDAKCAIRVSMGQQNTKQEVQAFIKVWKELYQRINTA